MLSGPRKGQEKDVWLSHKDTIALFSASVAQETVLFACSYKDLLRGVWAVSGTGSYIQKNLSFV